MRHPSVVLFDMMGTLLHVEPDAAPYWASIGRTLADVGLVDALECETQYAGMRKFWHAADNRERAPLE